MTEKQEGYVTGRAQVAILHAPLGKVLAIVDSARRFANNEFPHYGCSCFECELREAIDALDNHSQAVKAEGERVGFGE